MKARPCGSIRLSRYLLNPSRIHGIYDTDIQDCPTFQDVARDLQALIGNADLAGYNSNKFDIPLLIEEFTRSGIHFEIADRKLIDVQKHLSQDGATHLCRQLINSHCGKDLLNAHSAEADTFATCGVLGSLSWSDTTACKLTSIGWPSSAA